MGLTLVIENMPNLPDGGPLTYSVQGQRGLDIGRDAYLDWTLPDPSRFISSKHCEIRYRDGGYQLTDVSTNGTFLNGSQNRMQSPHRLRTGDRLSIGQYIVAVTVDEDAGGQAAQYAPAAQRGTWDDPGDVAPPIDPKELRPPNTGKFVNDDFLHQAMGSPDLYDLRAPRQPDPFRAPPGLPPATDPFRVPPPPDPFRAPPAAADAYAPPPPPPRMPAVADEFDWAPLTSRPAPVVEAAPPPPQPRRAPASPQVWADDPPAEASPPAPVARAENPFIQALPAAPPAAPFAPAASPFDAQEASPPRAATPPAPEAASAPAPAFGAAVSGGREFIEQFAKAAGIPVAQIAGQDPLALARSAGEIVRDVVDELMQLLRARDEAKRIARSSNKTLMQALDNNPLKSMPTAEEALRVMLGPPTRSYLDARRALRAGFADVKTHQVHTFAAMQAAMRMIAEELDPETIEKALPSSGGLAGVISSRNGRLWELYTARWKAKTERRDDGLVDVFMQYFTDCYDRNAGGNS